MGVRRSGRSLFLRAYSLGGGTYTGIEAVSNGLPIMREPRVQTGKRTMVYMAISLAVTAGGILLGYLLLGVHAGAGQDDERRARRALRRRLPAARPRRSASGSSCVTLLSEGALLFVAAQAGFVDGPRVMANMAHRLVAAAPLRRALASG